MRAQFVIPVIASILILGTLGLTDAFAGSNGNNGCENANPNAKACENNPNTDPVKIIQIKAAHSITEEDVEGAFCQIYPLFGDSYDTGYTDVNGELRLTLPDTIDVLYGLSCFKHIPDDFPISGGTNCNLALTERVTSFEIFMHFGGPFCDRL